MTYFLCLTALAGVIALFFGLARGDFRSFGTVRRVLRVLVVLPLLVSGTAHLTMPDAMAQIIPPVFPAKVLLVVLSGIAELAGAVGLLFRRTERAASLCLALLMMAIFPANIYVAGQTVHGMYMPSVPVRLLMQMLYISMLLAAGWGRPVLRSQ